MVYLNLQRLASTKRRTCTLTIPTVRILGENGTTTAALIAILIKGAIALRLTTIRRWKRQLRKTPSPKGLISFQELSALIMKIGSTKATQRVRPTGRNLIIGAETRKITKISAIQSMATTTIVSKTKYASHRLTC